MLNLLLSPCATGRHLRLAAEAKTSSSSSSESDEARGAMDQRVFSEASVMRLVDCIYTYTHIYIYICLYNKNEANNDLTIM